MSLIDLASLVLAPTATKEGKVYSAIPDTGQGDMTFTRGSAATRVNSEGLIEKERGNLLLQSNTFDTTWVSSNTTETGGQSGYDGSSDAWLLSKTSGYANLNQSVSASGVNTYSVYAKANTLNWLRIVGGSTSAFFDLNNGVVGSTDAGNIAKMTSIGSGWYRCEVAMNASTTIMRIYPAQANNDVSGTSGNILIQDAMLNQGLVAQSYIPTTTSAVYEGITDDVPRVDYSGGGCPSLLLESQRSNEVHYSEYFEASNWSIYSYGGASIVRDFGYISPEGKNNAYRFSYTAGSGGNGILLTDNFTATASVDYTLSVWMKGAVGGEKVRLCLMDTGSNGVIGSTFTLTNEWALYTDTITNSAGTNRGFQFRIQDVIGVNDDQVVYVYGAQAEQGSYATSYIPTYGTSTTRVADSCSKTGISELIGQTEGTMFIEFTRENNSVGTFSISANNVGTRIYIGTNASGLICQVRNGYAQQAYFSTAQTEGTTYKCAIAYATNDFVLYMNGTQIGTDTSGTVPACNTIRTDDAGGANLNQPLKQALLFPTRLTNDQLEELTK